MLEVLPAPVVTYLEQFELCLKAKSGVVPEDAIAVVRSQLEREYRRVVSENPDLSPPELLGQLVAKYGTPEEVAAQYQGVAKPSTSLFTGYAPGWRIYCTKCGRSTPLAKVGGVRIGAQSTHKYVLGWCRGCSWFRWLRVDQDLDETNITEQLGTTNTPEQLRSSIHLPGRLLTVIAAMGLLALIVRLVWLFV